MDEGALSDVIGRIYDAAIEPEHLSNLLQKISDSLGGHHTVLALMDKSDPTRSLAFSARVDPAALDDYVAYYAERDLWLQSAARLPAGATFTGPMLVPKGTFASRLPIWSKTC